LIKADADVIASGLLLDLKTDSKLSLGVTTMFQVLGYALLDFDDTYQLSEMGTFSARYAYLAIWDIGTLLDELAGRHVSLPAVRQEFRQLLLAHQLSVNGSLPQCLHSSPRPKIMKRWPSHVTMTHRTAQGNPDNTNNMG
jgi:hypothetical protein